MKSILPLVLLIPSFCKHVQCFTTSNSIHHTVNTIYKKQSKIQATPQTHENPIKLSFCKPIGIVLDKSTCNGVLVDSIIEGGSAFEHIDTLIGLRISKVFNEDVLSFTCDQLQDVINSSPSPVTIEFTTELTVVGDVTHDNSFHFYKTKFDFCLKHHVCKMILRHGFHAYNALYLT